MNKELLPIGTVVLLSGGTKKVMITGYKSKEKGAPRVYDYNGCVFPEGFMNNAFILFDRNQIEEIFYEGLKNEEFDNLSNTIKNDVKVTAVSVDQSNKISNSKPAPGTRRVRTTPSKIVSKGEMLSKYGVKKASGHGVNVIDNVGGKS